MRGFSIYRTYIIICELCNENIVERADELSLDMRQAAEDYAREHRQQHIDDGSWPARASGTSAVVTRGLGT